MVGIPSSHTEALYRESIVTVAFPGFAASRSQIAKYTGSDGVTVLCRDASQVPKDPLSIPEASRATMVGCRGTAAPGAACKKICGETEPLQAIDDEDDMRALYHSVCAKAPQLLYNVMPSPEINELVSNKWSWNPLHWLTMIKSRVASWYFGCSGVPTSYMVLCRVSMGGFDDQMSCQRDVERAVALIESEKSSNGQQRSARKIVMFGCSRGATTTCLTALKLPEHLAKHVALVICEAPFDTFEGVLHDSSWFPGVALKIMKRFGKYSGDQGAYLLPTSTHLACPMAFITSDVDRRVPKKTTVRLMRDVAARFPHLKVTHLELEKSHHSLMSLQHKSDVRKYEEFVHELYDSILDTP